MKFYLKKIKKKTNKIDSLLKPKKNISNSLLRNQIANIQYGFYNYIAENFAGDYCGFSYVKLIPKDENTIEILNDGNKFNQIICINQIYKDKKKTTLSPSIKYKEVIGEISFDKFGKGTYVIEGEVISTNFLSNRNMPFKVNFQKK